jgi:hypothetical protein
MILPKVITTQILCYMNVFHIKTSNGLSCNTEYFYNDRYISSDDQIGQILWEISMCEIINVHVHATNCNAGGQNTGTVNSLHNNKEVPEIGWLPEECVSFKNPVFLNCWV